jgi:hypothetical protein
MTTPQPSMTGGVGDQPVILDPNASVIRLLKLQRTWDWLVLSDSAGRALVSGAGRREHFLNVLKHYARERILARADRGEAQDTGDLVKVFGQSAFQLSSIEKAELLGSDDRPGNVPPFGRGLRRPPYRDGPLTVPDPHPIERPPVEIASPRTETPPRGHPPERSPDADALEGWLRVHPDEVLAQMRASTRDAATAHHPIGYEALSVSWAQTLIRIGRLQADQLPATVQRWLTEDTRVRLEDDSLPNFESARQRAALIDSMIARVPLARSARDAAQPALEQTETPAWRLRSGAKAPRQFNVPRDLPLPPDGPVQWVLGPKGARPAEPPTERPSRPFRTTSHGAPGLDDDIPPPTDEDAGWAWPEQFADDGPPIEDIAPDYLPDETNLRYEPIATPPAPRVTPAPAAFGAQCYSAREIVEGEVVGTDGSMARLTRTGATTPERFGPLHRTDGPAIVATEAPERDRYFDDGVERVLRIPPALARVREFATHVYETWRSLGYPGADAGETASRLLHTEVPQSLATEWLGALRASTHPSDVVFLHAFNTGYGMRPEHEGGIGQ